jgi:ATP-dependent Clp protease ATP-binding subunit ClpA
MLRLVLHVRPGTLDRVVVTSVDFPARTRDARDVERARAFLRPKLISDVQRLAPAERVALLESGDSELVRVPFEVQAASETSDAIEITLGIVVTNQTAGGHPIYLVRSPVVPRIRGMVKDRAKIDALVIREARKLAKDVRPSSLLASDEPADSRLEIIELEVSEDDGVPAKATTDSDDEAGVLETYGEELTAKGPRALGMIDRRDDLVERVLAILAAPERSSVLLVGPPGVGKTALVHHLATRLIAGDVPEGLKGRKLYRAAANDLIANARYTGMWQGRFHDLATQLRNTKAICAVGDAVEIVEAGRHSTSDNNAARLLRPYIETGAITIIVEATAEQLAAARLKEPSFIDSLNRIDVPEPGFDDVRAIARAAAARLGESAVLELGPDAVDAAIELTTKFEPYRGNPGKVVRLLEEAIRDRTEGIERLDRAETTRVFARRTGLPLVLLSDDVQLNAAQVREHFESRVLGQPEATTAMQDLVATLKAGLTAPGKPLGSFFFVGPTGVGKTELAKALAEFLFGSRDRVLRLDMGEFGSGDAVAKLIGSGWESDADGALTRRIRQQPFSVVLLDEIEKADPSVFDALLGVLGEGRLTDASGRTANFDNAIVIMTSNLGASRSRTATLGFATGGGDEQARLEHHYREQAEKFFRPEFFNRIDRIVVFHPLDEAIVRQIARRELGKLFLREGIVRRKLLVEVDEAVVEELATRGMDPQYGARPLQRAIERAVIQPLARLIVDRRPEPGSLARVHLRDGHVSIELEPIREAERPKVTRASQRVAHEESTFAKAIAAAEEFERRLEAEESTPAVSGLRGEVSALISKTHDPAFWDDNAAARSTLARVYQLEQVLDRLDALRRRASGLSEMARQANASRFKGRLPEVWAAIDEMEDALEVGRLEIAGALAGGRGKGAVLAITAVGEGSAEWAAQLFEMYCSWADRTARDITRVAERQHTARIEGLSTFDLLRGESGLHRRIHADRRVVLARVSIAPLDGDSTGDGRFESGSVVRVYEEGRRQLVRDPRTGTKETRIDAVIGEGKIDAFLYAWLRLQRDRDAVT